MCASEPSLPIYYKESAFLYIFFRNVPLPDAWDFFAFMPLVYMPAVSEMSIVLPTQTKEISFGPWQLSGWQLSYSNEWLFNYLWLFQHWFVRRLFLWLYIFATSFNVKNVIEQPNWITNNYATLIDHILCNIDMDVSAGVWDIAIADHCPSFVVWPQKYLNSVSDVSIKWSTRVDYNLVKAYWILSLLKTCIMKT